jgi:Kef-type K+ transport system membrane component KefB
MHAKNHRSHLLHRILGYAAAIGAALLLFAWIRWLGADLSAPAPPPGQELFSHNAASQGFDTLLHVLLALAVIIIVARLTGVLFQRLHQPAVIGEVIAGIVLGPSLLGALWPAASAYLLPADIVPMLSAIAQIGVVLFMFVVGVELNHAPVRNAMNTVIAISHAGIIVPFLLGSALSLILYQGYATSDVPFGVFVLFMGISMSVTAFPVLARILFDRGIQNTRLGSIALSCAASGDVVAWCLLAIVISAAKADARAAVQTVLAAIAFVIFMLVVVRRVIAILVRREANKPQLSQSTLTTLLIALLVSAFFAERIGIHALFGAFLLGATIPHDSTLARNLVARLKDFIVVFFLPVYFAFTGLRTELGLLGSLSDWLFCGLIIAVASAGKFGGAVVAARLTGLRWREGAALGILMNTRGLMELIVLNIGLDMKVLSPTLFVMLVLMAIITTVATTPVLDWLNRDGRLFASLPAPQPTEGSARTLQAADEAAQEHLVETQLTGR